MTISHRIWVLTLLPIILLIGFFGWLLFGLLSDEARTQRLMLGASTMDAVSGLTSSVQIERGRSAQFLSSKGAQYHDELTAQRAQTEASRGNSPRRRAPRFSRSFDRMRRRPSTPPPRRSKV
jgi:hypothetical protein